MSRKEILEKIEEICFLTEQMMQEVYHISNLSVPQDLAEEAKIRLLCHNKKRLLVIEELIKLGQ